MQVRIKRKGDLEKNSSEEIFGLNSQPNSDSLRHCNPHLTYQYHIVMIAPGDEKSSEATIQSSV